MSINIGTDGWTYGNNSFYPSNISILGHLQYYSSKYDTVLFSIPYDDNLSEESCKETIAYMIEQVESNPNFKFMVMLPVLFSSATIKNSVKIWEYIWGLCQAFETSGKLGPICIPFKTKFVCNEKNIRKLKSITKIIPKHLKLVFFFMHWTWWESQEVEELFEKNKNWAVATQYIENGLISHGWAGTLPSTRIRSNKNRMPIIATGNFVFIYLYGTLGPQMGSYDNHRFLEEFSVKLRMLKDKGLDVHVIFSNGETTYCFQLPIMLVSGYLCNPKLKSLSNPREIDYPCSIHDSLKLKNILEIQNRSEYTIHEAGFVKIKFG